MGSDVATTDPSDIEAYAGDVAEGLEDVGAGDVLLPIIKVLGKEGKFQDSLSNEKFDEFDAIILGLVKQRILWPSEVGESGEQPICRSLNFTHGRPDPVKFISKDVSGQFPSKVSKFGKERIERAITALEEDGPEADSDDLLPCASCNLQNWETNPKNNTPWCGEQYVFPLLRINEEGLYLPGYITFQRASLKAVRSYLSVFKGVNKPMYTVRTHIKALHQKKGQVDYVTPEFTKGVGTDPEQWPEFSTALADIRRFLTIPRARREDSTTTDTDDDDEVVETPAPKARGKKADVIDTTATDTTPDPDDEPTEPDTPNTVPDEDEADDDEPTPSAKKGKAAPAPAADDDDEEEPF